MNSKNIKKKATKYRLNTIKELKRFAASLLNQLNNEEISEAKFRAIFYGINIYSQILNNNLLEQKVTEIEGKINELKSKNNAA